MSQLAAIEGGSMDSGIDDEVLGIALLTVLLSRRQKRRRSKRKMWVRSILSQRRQRGESHTLLREMRLNDTQAHFSYLWMSRERFEHLAIVGPLLVRRENYWSAIRANITPAETLALTIRYLATGNSQISLSFNFRLGKSTVCHILRETCEVLWNTLMPLYVKAPSTEREWKGVSDQFEHMWNFPHCMGAIDGKDIVVQAPPNSGSTVSITRVHIRLC